MNEKDLGRGPRRLEVALLLAALGAGCGAGAESANAPDGRANPANDAMAVGPADSNPKPFVSATQPSHSAAPVASAQAPIEQLRLAPASPTPTPTTESDPAETAALRGMSESERAVLLVVKHCTEQALRANEEPKGSLAIELTVGDDGAVVATKLAKGYPAGMRACTEQRLKAIRFPAGGGTRFLRYPINETAGPAE